MQLWLFAGAALLLALTPGPGILYVGARTLAGGVREGVASTLGTALGGMVHVLAGAAGLSALLLASAEAFTAVKLIGCAYLIWLGIRAWREAKVPLPPLGQVPAMGVWRAWREGVVVEALNPKTAAFFLAFIPQFVSPAHGAAGQFILLGSICVAANTLVDLAVALGIGRLREGTLARPGLLLRLRLASAAMMVALGLGTLFLRRPA